MKTKKTNSKKANFDDNGFVSCQGFAAEQLSEILINLQRVIRDVVPAMPAEHVFFEDRSNPDSLKQLQQLNLHDPFFGDLMDRGAFRELAEELLGESVFCKNMQYFNKPPTTGQATPPHQDGYYFKLDSPAALTMWLALDNVDEENGCVRYVRGSHHHPMRPHGSTGTPGFSQGITDFPNGHDRENEIAFPAAPGDLLAHHSMTIHRADGNRSKNRSRRAIGFIYYGVSASEDVLSRQKYQTELKEELTRSGKI